MRKRGQRSMRMLPVSPHLARSPFCLCSAWSAAVHAPSTCAPSSLQLWPVKRRQCSCSSLLGSLTFHRTRERWGQTILTEAPPPGCGAPPSTGRRCPTPSAQWAGSSSRYSNPREASLSHLTAASSSAEPGGAEQAAQEAPLLRAGAQLCEERGGHGGEGSPAAAGEGEAGQLCGPGLHLCLHLPGRTLYRLHV